MTTKIPSNPFLIQPLLHISNIIESVTNQEIVEGLRECLRLKPTIIRTGNDNALATGSIEFETLLKAEKAYATVATHFPQHNCTLSLHISSPPNSDPLPTSIPRIVKNLPLETTAGELFDLFRTYGPIYRATLSLNSSQTFEGNALVLFYDESHARTATAELHCFEYRGATLLVKKQEALKGVRKQSMWADSPVVVPTSPKASINSSPTIQSTPARKFSSTSQSIYSNSPSPSTSTPTSTRILSNQIYSTPVRSTTGLSSPSIDPCNLFIKSLDPSITSKELESLFESFGIITSAKVMLDEITGISKGFGFVSFETSNSAKNALEMMDGKKLGSSQKSIVVRLHETKSYREEKLKELKGSSPISISNEVEEVTNNLNSLSTTTTTTINNKLPSSPALIATPEFKSVSTSMIKSNSSTSSAGSPGLEKERLLTAIKKIDSEKAEEILEMFEGLPKKERALCLFNPDYLRSKVYDALLVLSTSSDDEEEAGRSTMIQLSSPSTSLPTPASTPKSTSSPLFLNTPTSPSFNHSKILPKSIAELGRLPAIEIINLIQSGILSKTLGIERVSTLEEENSNNFYNDLSGKVQEMKQKLGEKLFKSIKGMGIKGAPKITINLLDSEELRALNLLIDYPIVLREKVLSHVPSPSPSLQ